ncbi:MAG: arsenate reductase ArsC [Alphaproteobacteria bacterium]
MASSAVLFACNHNAVRSAMAESIAKHLYGHALYIDSVGVQPGELDPFAVAAMEEIGIDLSSHTPKSFDDLEDSSYDLIVSLTPEAQHRAVEMTRTMACDVEYWATFDPTIVEGNRETRLAAYRQTRDALFRKIKERFDRGGPPQV